MDSQLFCQSCSMPLDSEALKGTERDGSKSNEYCKYCYENGEMVNPDMTLDEMKAVVKTQMEKMHLSPELVRMSLNLLPGLKRWKSKSVIL